jgi:hypothetical protein
MESMDEKVAEFRRAYRADVPRGYSAYRHLAGTIALPAAGMAGCIVGLDDVQPLEWLTVPASFVYANLVEYASHRGPMHRPVRGVGALLERHARQHHRFFTDEDMQLETSTDLRVVLFPLVLFVFYIGVFVLPLALVLAWLATRNVALLFLATGLGYYLNYELLHLAYHASPRSLAARIPGLGLLRRLHARHHDPILMHVCNFNITYPIGDWLFKTLLSVRASR